MVGGSHSNQSVVQYNSNSTASAKTATGVSQAQEVKQAMSDPKAVSADAKQEETRAKDSLREAALEVHYVLRPEKLDEGSKFLANPDWPPLDALNGVASIFIDDFFLKKVEL